MAAEVGTEEVGTVQNCAHELKLCRRVVVVCEELLRGLLLVCGVVGGLENEKNLN